MSAPFKHDTLFSALSNANQLSDNIQFLTKGQQSALRHSLFIARFSLLSPLDRIITAKCLNCQQEFARWLIERQGKRLPDRCPLKFPGFIVKAYGRWAFTLAGIVQQNEMGITVEFLGVDAVLHHNKLNTGDFESGFLLDFTPQRIDGGLAPFDLAARDSPKIGPFVSSHHEHLPGGIKNQSTDGHDGRMAIFELLNPRFKLHLVLLENA